MNAARRAAAGAAIWLVAAIGRVPHALHPAWAQALLLFAALVLVPLLLEIVRRGQTAEPTAPWRDRFLRWAARQQFLAALLLVTAFALPAGKIAALLAIPWAAVLLLLALAGVAGSFGARKFSLARLCGDAGLIYSAVAAAWLLADRSGLRPLDFSEDIVLLTAVHFHYAGLLLPVLTGKVLAEFRPSAATALLGCAVIVGVPAVAVGITAAQLKRGSGYELVAVGIMALGGAGVAILQAILATQPRWPLLVRGWWWLSSASLLVGMMFASVYGLRNVTLILPWLDVPWMRALHGSINALGFGGAATLAWFLALRRSPPMGPSP